MSDELCKILFPSGAFDISFIVTYRLVKQIVTFTETMLQGAVKCLVDVLILMFKVLFALNDQPLENHYFKRAIQKQIGIQHRTVINDL